MSHYTVAVFTDGHTTVDELLEPFSEDIRVAPYVSCTKEQMIARAKEIAESYREKIKSDDDSAQSYEWMKPYADAKTDEELYALRRDDEHCEYDSDGNELSTYNPDSKWDWYDVGGRWGDSFAPYGIDPYGTRVGDIRSFFDEEAYRRAIRDWEIIVEGRTPPAGEEERFRGIYGPEFYRKRYGNKETYAKCRSGFYTFAVLLPNGMWYEPGQMGWFGMDSGSDEDHLTWEKNYVERFLKTADPDWTLTIVDCHI